MNILIWLISPALLLITATAYAEVPTLEPVDTAKAPLTLSAPAGWAARLSPPKRKDLSTIASISPDCAGGPDISVMIQLDRQISQVAKLLSEQYPGASPQKLHGWDCVVRPANTEAMCAGKVNKLAGVVSVYFATTDAAAFNRLGSGEFAAQVAASLKWTGGSVDKLAEWSRPAEASAKSACGK